MHVVVLKQNNNLLTNFYRVKQLSIMGRRKALEFLANVMQRKFRSFKVNSQRETMPL